MTQREIIMLGTASEAPTVARSQTSCLLLWDGRAILFDAGEGVQRQLACAGVSPATIDRICITHFHGDHCLGLPGVLMRLAADSVPVPVPIHYPSAGERYFQRLRRASAGQEGAAMVTARPIVRPGVIERTDDFTLSCAPLSHGVDTVGYRLREHDGRRFEPDRLAALGIEGADIGRLREHGWIRHSGRIVTIDEVSAAKRGQVFAYVLDTRWCDAALELSDGADLLVCESTFLDRDRDLAERFGHLTAGQAGRLAREAGVRRLVLTHFSRRYGDAAEFAREAGAEFADVIVAADLDRIDVPPRR